MKPFYSFLLIGLFFCHTLIAQTRDKKLKYGLKGGVNFSSVALSGSYITPNLKNGVSNITSFYFGAYAELALSHHFALQSGLSVSGKGSKIDIETLQFIPFVGNLPIRYQRETNIMYLEVPVNAVYNYKNFYLGAGPYLAYGVAGSEKINSTVFPSKDGAVKFGNNVGEINPLDYGANFLLGYQLKNGFNIGVNYGLGLGKTNIVSGFDIDASNRVFTVLAGFAF